MIDNSTFSTLKAKYVTFGCKLNFAETASIADMLRQQGVMEARNTENPDIVVVNTCSVTSVADRKCRSAIRTLARRFPDAAVIVTGCYAQLKPEEVAELPGVHIVLGNDRKTTLPQVLAQWLESRKQHIDIRKAKDFNTFEHSCSRGNRTRYFLKVQDGCNYFCSYCTIPFARGRSRSPQIATLVDQARKVAEEGGKEIVLTGVNVGDFGRKGNGTFLELIERLDKVEGIERYRISSIEPNLLSEEIIHFVARSRHFMPHFHIPLQSGDDEVLTLMRRHYDTHLFKQKIELIRGIIPDAFIGVDLIVGMRGETEQRFLNSLGFVDSLDISRLHVFPYSEREGTAALQIPHVVAPQEKSERAARMLALSAEKEKAFSQRMEGSRRPVLFEKMDTESGTLTGHTDNYIKVVAHSADDALINTVHDVVIGPCRPDTGEGYFSTATLK